MSNKFIFIVSTLVAVASMQLRAQDYTPVQDTKKVVNRLSRQAATTQHISAKFTELKYLAALKEPGKSSGVFYYQKDNKMRWEQQQPSSYILLVNENDIKLAENGKEKKMAGGNRVASKIKDLMLTLVNGNFHESKEFKPAYFENAKEYIVILTPLNPRLKKVFSKIELHFAKNDLVLNKLLFLETSGDKSIMTFTDQLINTPQNPRLFTEF